MYHSIILPLPISFLIKSNVKISVMSIVGSIIILLVFEFFLFFFQSPAKAFFNGIFVASPVGFSYICINYLMHEGVIPKNGNFYFFLLPFVAFSIFAYIQIKENNRCWVLYIGGFITWLILLILSVLFPPKFAEFVDLLIVLIYVLFVWGLLGVNLHLSVKNDDYLS